MGQEEGGGEDKPDSVRIGVLDDDKAVSRQEGASVRTTDGVPENRAFRALGGEGDIGVLQSRLYEGGSVGAIHLYGRCSQVCGAADGCGCYHGREDAGAHHRQELVLYP